MGNLSTIEMIIVYFLAILSAFGYICICYKYSTKLKKNEIINKNYIIYEDNEETRVV